MRHRGANSRRRYKRGWSHRYSATEEEELESDDSDSSMSSYDPQHVDPLYSNNDGPILPSFFDFEDYPNVCGDASRVLLDNEVCRVMNSDKEKSNSEQTNQLRRAIRDARHKYSEKLGFKRAILLSVFRYLAERNTTGLLVPDIANMSDESISAFYDVVVRHTMDTYNGLGLGTAATFVSKVLNNGDMHSLNHEAVESAVVFLALALETVDDWPRWCRTQRRKWWGTPSEETHSNRSFPLRGRKHNVPSEQREPPPITRTSSTTSNRSRKSRHSKGRHHRSRSRQEPETIDIETEVQNKLWIDDSPQRILEVPRDASSTKKHQNGSFREVPLTRTRAKEANRKHRASTSNSYRNAPEDFRTEESGRNTNRLDLRQSASLSSRRGADVAQGSSGKSRFSLQRKGSARGREWNEKRPKSISPFRRRGSMKKSSSPNIQWTGSSLTSTNAGMTRRGRSRRTDKATMGKKLRSLSPYQKLRSLKKAMRKPSNPPSEIHVEEVFYNISEDESLMRMARSVASFDKYEAGDVHGADTPNLDSVKHQPQRRNMVRLRDSRHSPHLRRNTSGWI